MLGICVARVFGVHFGAVSLQLPFVEVLACDLKLGSLNRSAAPGISRSVNSFRVRRFWTSWVRPSRAHQQRFGYMWLREVEVYKR